MEVEKIVLDNVKQISCNTANIGVLMKLTYIMIGGILTQVIVFVGSIRKGKSK